MKEWVELLSNIGAPVGVMLVFLHWLTQKLVPAMEKRADNALQAFREEMREERVMHRESINGIYAHLDDLTKEISRCPKR